jgi:tetratricopeptide (TPR) repeat protein
MRLFNGKNENEKLYEKLQNDKSGIVSLAIEEDNFNLVVSIGKGLTGSYPQCSYGWEIMGDGYINLEKYEEAIYSYEKTIGLNSPNFFLNMLQLAIAYEGAGKISEALENFQMCLRLDSENFYGRHDYLQESISYLTSLLKSQPQMNSNDAPDNEDELMQQIMELGDLGVECAFNNKPVPVERALDRLDLIRIKVEKYDMLSATEMVIRQIERINRARVN